jgi:hypothetical protein
LWFSRCKSSDVAGTAIAIENAPAFAGESLSSVIPPIGSGDPTDHFVAFDRAHPCGAALLQPVWRNLRPFLASKNGTLRASRTAVSRPCSRSSRAHSENRRIGRVDPDDTEGIPLPAQPADQFVRLRLAAYPQQIFAARIGLIEDANPFDTRGLLPGYLDSEGLRR